MNIEVKDIIAHGTVGGQNVTFHATKDREGMYSLSRVIGRKAGTRPGDPINKVQVTSLDQAAKLLCDTKEGKPIYYIWLTYKEGGVRRRAQYAPKSIEIIWNDPSRR